MESTYQDSLIFTYYIVPHKIQKAITGRFSQLNAVAFAETNLDQIIPMHFLKMLIIEYIIDFEANAKGFGKVKVGSTGGSYSYESD